MESLAGILWAIFGVGLIVAEVFTLGFFLLWFGIGALAAAFAALFGFNVAVQFLVFALVSISLTALSRSIFYNTLFAHNQNNDLKSGIDALPGKLGTVVHASKGTLNEGAVKVFGTTWTAFPIDEAEPLQEGEKVEIVRVQGSSVIVRRPNKLPEWHASVIPPEENNEFKE
jgi:membrane protein implicated in regulation of membrane protease activity